ncbi:hypothetical protein CRM22_007971 [Opisthorchis felineus]|uniref:Ig-like domain-containing protein n=1 Tax=Opisthorchis felineus TaxID=147828 RepID=A0A4V3SDP5_OPIFE|nr:hypothetical protein CRM22_007971 [Opisthorchis felineus]
MHFEHVNTLIVINVLTYCGQQFASGLPTIQTSAGNGRASSPFEKQNNYLNKSDKLQTTKNSVAINGQTSTKEKPTRGGVQYKPKDPKKAQENSPRFVKFDTGETIRLRCRILRGPYLVMWNKLGLDYPLTIGTRRFSPDERIRTQYKAPDKWVLTIAAAKLTDSGVYTCTTSTNSAPTDQFQHPCLVESKDGAFAQAEYANISCQEENSDSVQDIQSNKKGSNEYYVTVVEPELRDRYQVDAPAKDKLLGRKQITVTGPLLVFYGTPLELICRASFPTDEAKMNPKITLEWYHLGVRRRTHPTRSGGIFISERWVDSHILESRLLVTWASEADAGQWICLDRSVHSTGRGTTVKEQNNLGFGHDRRDEINFLPMNPNFSLIKNQLSSISHSTADIGFDRIDVMVIDLPDPTESSLAATASPVPAYMPMNDQAPQSTKQNFTAVLARAGSLRGSPRLSLRPGNAVRRRSYFVRLISVCTVLTLTNQFIVRT